MDTRKSAGPATATAGSPSGGTFRIRYGRTGIALVGLLSLLTAFVSGVLSLFGLGTPVLPLTCLALTAGSVVLLRWLAVRDRRAKVNAAFRAAMSAPAGKGRPQPEAVASVPPKPQAAPAKKDNPLLTHRHTSPGSSR